MELMTISEAARHLGYKSRSQLCRLINDGYLHEHVHLQKHTEQLWQHGGVAGEAAVHAGAQEFELLGSILSDQWAKMAIAGPSLVALLCLNSFVW